MLQREAMTFATSGPTPKAMWRPAALPRPLLRLSRKRKASGFQRGRGARLPSYRRAAALALRYTEEPCGRLSISVR